MHISSTFFSKLGVSGPGTSGTVKITCGASTGRPPSNTGSMLTRGTLSAPQGLGSVTDRAARLRSINHFFTIRDGVRSKDSACMSSACPQTSSLTRVYRSFGRDGASDVSKAYISDYEEACRGKRRAQGWSERHLKAVSAVSEESHGYAEAEVA